MEKVSCNICGKKFDTEEALDQHKNDAHKQQEDQTLQPQKKMSRGKLLVILIPILFFGIIAYGLFWALTTESIGSIGSAHIHADFAIFLNGKQVTPLPREYFILIPYIHLEAGPGQGSVLHMLATNVPLKMFFDSVGMTFNSNCFEIDRNNRYCNSGTDTLKMFVKHENSTWEQDLEYQKYVFKDLDKILITYGHETNDEIQNQENNVTNFAKDNTGRSLALGIG